MELKINLNMETNELCTVVSDIQLKSECFSSLRQ